MHFKYNHKTIRQGKALLVIILKERIQIQLKMNVKIIIMKIIWIPRKKRLRTWLHLKRVIKLKALAMVPMELLIQRLRTTD